MAAEAEAEFMRGALLCFALLFLLCIDAARAALRHDDLFLGLMREPLHERVNALCELCAHPSA
jgi:hypothetical protein